MKHEKKEREGAGIVNMVDYNDVKSIPMLHMLLNLYSYAVAKKT